MTYNTLNVENATNGAAVLVARPLEEARDWFHRAGTISAVSVVDGILREISVFIRGEGVVRFFPEELDRIVDARTAAMYS